MKRRYLKNTLNDRTFPWTKALAKKEGMVECDEFGNIKLEDVSIEEGELLTKMQEKAKECNELRKENLKLKAKLAEYDNMVGDSNEQLPVKTLDDKIKEAEEAGELVTNKVELATNKVEVVDYSEMTNSSLKNLIKERGLQVPVKFNKDNLIAVLVEGDSTGE